MSLLPSRGPEQREGSDSAMGLPPKSDSRDLREAHIGGPLEGISLRAPGRSEIVARAEESAEDETSQVGRGGLGLG